MKLELAVAFLVLLSLGGCASAPHPAFQKAGVTPEQRRRDENDCVKRSMAVGGPWLGIGVFKVDRGLFESCMTARGYEAWR